MKHTLEQQLAHLAELLENAQNPKIVWEEMQIVGEHAFDLQDKIMDALDAAEEKETDIQAVQCLFETREYVWDLMNQIALCEAALKEKTFPNGLGEKEHKKSAHKHTCCCGHKHEGEHNCCGHHADEHTCGCGHDHGADKKCCTAHPKKKTGGCCRQKSAGKTTKKCCKKSK